jgi:serine/threonine protein kinase
MDEDTLSAFAPGQTIDIVVKEDTFIFTVDKPFLPFTKSVVLLAHCNEFSSSQVVIKIFDPRFLDERYPFGLLPRPWTPTAEEAAATARDPASNSVPFDKSQLWEDEPEDEEGKRERAALWEEHFYRLMVDCFDAESASYKRLEELQGSAIPRLLSSGHFLARNVRYIQPPAVVLEYIPGISLRDIAADLLSPEICVKLVSYVDAFASHGIYHDDMNHHNVLFEPAECPKRGVIIDFGCAGVKEDGEDEEIWQFNVTWADDSKRLRRMLKDKGIVIPDVISPEDVA